MSISVSAAADFLARMLKEEQLFEGSTSNVLEEPPPGIISSILATDNIP